MTTPRKAIDTKFSLLFTPRTSFRNVSSQRQRKKGKIVYYHVGLAWLHRTLDSLHASHEALNFAAFPSVIEPAAMGSRGEVVLVLASGILLGGLGCL